MKHIVLHFERSHLLTVRRSKGKKYHLQKTGCKYGAEEEQKNNLLHSWLCKKEKKKQHKNINEGRIHLLFA